MEPNLSTHDDLNLEKRISNLLLTQFSLKFCNLSEFLSNQNTFIQKDQFTKSHSILQTQEKMQNLQEIFNTDSNLELNQLQFRQKHCNFPLFQTTNISPNDILNSVQTTFSYSSLHVGFDATIPLSTSFPMLFQNLKSHPEYTFLSSILPFPTFHSEYFLSGELFNSKLNHLNILISLLIAAITDSINNFKLLVYYTQYQIDNCYHFQKYQVSFNFMNQWQFILQLHPKTMKRLEKGTRNMFHSFLRMLSSSVGFSSLPHSILTLGEALTDICSPTPKKLIHNPIFQLTLLKTPPDIIQDPWIFHSTFSLRHSVPLRAFSKGIVIPLLPYLLIKIGCSESLSVESLEPDSLSKSSKAFPAPGKPPQKVSTLFKYIPIDQKWPLIPINWINKISKKLKPLDSSEARSVIVINTRHFPNTVLKIRVFKRIKPEARPANQWIHNFITQESPFENQDSSKEKYPFLKPKSFGVLNVSFRFKFKLLCSFYDYILPIKPLNIPRLSINVSIKRTHYDICSHPILAYIFFKEFIRVARKLQGCNIFHGDFRPINIVTSIRFTPETTIFSPPSIESSSTSPIETTQDKNGIDTNLIDTQSIQSIPKLSPQTNENYTNSSRSWDIPSIQNLINNFQIHITIIDFDAAQVSVIPNCPFSLPKHFHSHFLPVDEYYNTGSFTIDANIYSLLLSLSLLILGHHSSKLFRGFASDDAKDLRHFVYDKDEMERFKRLYKKYSKLKSKKSKMNKGTQAHSNRERNSPASPSRKKRQRSMDQMDMDFDQAETQPTDESPFYHSDDDLITKSLESDMELEYYQEQRYNFIDRFSMLSRVKDLFETGFYLIRPTWMISFFHYCLSNLLPTDRGDPFASHQNPSPRIRPSLDEIEFSLDSMFDVQNILTKTDDSSTSINTENNEIPPDSINKYSSLSNGTWKAWIRKRGFTDEQIVRYMII